VQATGAMMFLSQSECLVGSHRDEEDCPAHHCLHMLR
jgi:hypothetical protein